EIHHALLTQFHDDIGKHGFAHGGRLEHSVVINRLFRHVVFNAESPAPAELRAPDDSNGESRNFRLPHPFGNLFLQIVNQSFPKSCLLSFGRCRLPFSLGESHKWEKRKTKGGSTTLNQKISSSHTVSHCPGFPTIGFKTNS